MKATSLPVFCCIAITAMLAAGTSHWWSVRQFVATFDGDLPTHSAQISPLLAESSVEQSQQESAPAAADNTHKQEFYEALIAKMARVEDQNRDLLDQLAETNRDLMKLEFRVDTHSDSFRPLPLDQQSPFISLDSDIGVLPPRAEPVALPSYE